MHYQVDFLQEAREDLRNVPAHLRPGILRVIAVLTNTPHPPKSKALRDLPGLHRIPLENWRIIYHLDDFDSVVTIIRVRRKTGPEVYQDLPHFP